MEVALTNLGKVTTGDWHDFWIKFKMAWIRVPDASSDEASRLFMGKVPAFMINWIIEEQESRNRKRPVVNVRGGGYSPAEIKARLHSLVGVNPQKILPKASGEAMFVLGRERKQKSY